MKWSGRASATVAALGLAMATCASAQSPPPGRQGGRRSQRGGGPAVSRLAPPPGPMGGVFSFVGPLSDVTSNVVKGQPFSAQVVRDTIENLADGNRIKRTSTGMIARDSQGRTRREITLQNIGPWAAAGKAPQLVIIDDPVAGKAYVLDQSDKVATEMGPTPRLNWVSEDQGNSNDLGGTQADTKTKSLGTKKMDGVLVEGTETIRTIPAGKIGNEKPILITRERWYSPQLETTVLLTHTDPRFGTTTYEMKNIELSEPAQSLFEVPRDYSIQEGRSNRASPRSRGGGAAPNPGSQ